MAQFTPTSNPRGGRTYDEEPDQDKVSAGAPRPLGAERTSSRDASSRHRRQRRRHHDEDLEGAEQAAADGSASTEADVANEERDALVDAAEADSFYTEEKKRGVAGWSRRKKAGAGVLGAFGFGIIGYFVMSIGPFQALQLAQIVQNAHFFGNESMMDGRASRLVYYGKNSPHRGNLTSLGNRVADRFETKLIRAGLTPSYDNPDTGRPTRSMQSFTIDPETPQGQQALVNLRGSGVDIPAPGADGKIMIRLRGFGSEGLSRKVIKGSLGAIGIHKTTAWIGGRFMIKRADAKFKWLKRLVPEAGEATVDAYRRRNLEWDEQIGNGSTDFGSPRRPADAPDVPGDDDVVVPGDANATAGNLADKLNDVGGAVGLLSFICALDKFGDGIALIQQANVVLPLIRTGALAISAGSQVMSNDGFNAAELGAYSMRLFDPDTGLGWSAARSIQAEMGVRNPTGPDMPSSGRPGRGKPAIFRRIDSIINQFNLQGACNVLNSPVGGAAADGADIILAGASGLGPLIAEILAQIASYAASPFLNDLARWLAGEPLNEFAQGALFGNHVNYGARLMANDSAVSMGGVEMSGTDTAAVDAERDEAYRVELQNKGVFARLFDPKERGSLVARTVLQNPNLANTQAATSHFAQMPTTVFNQISSSFANIFSPKLQAINVSGYDYGFPEYGYPLGLQQDTRFDDPYQNGEIVEAMGLDRDAKLNENYGIPCFNTTVSETGVITTLDSKPMGEIPEKCKGTGEALLRYRFYLADTAALKSLACLENIDEGACTEMGLGSGAAVGSAGGDGSATIVDGTTKSLAQRILDIANSGGGITLEDNPRISLEQAARGEPSTTNASNAGRPSAPLDPKLLQAILALHEAGIPIRLSSFTTGTHADGSQHYTGHAVDIGNEEEGPRIMDFLFANRQQLSVYDLFFDPIPSKNIDNGSPCNCSIGGHSGHIHLSTTP